MIDSRRKLLTEQGLGECWHEWWGWTSPTKGYCGTCLVEGRSPEHRRRTFSDPDDYEALREKVIVHHARKFAHYIDFKADTYDHIEWWLKLSPEQCNEIIHDFGIECLGWEVK